jgi:hypothetical protein
MSFYIRVYATLYITSCLAKLGWDTSSNDLAVLVLMPPSSIKEMDRSPGHLGPIELLSIVNKFGFQYRTLTGMLIFAVQIGQFDITPVVSILCKFNDRPGAVHFLAAKKIMRYLCSEIDHGLIYWCPTGKDRPDFPHGSLTHFCPESNIDVLYPHIFSVLEPVCFVDVSYGGLITIGEPHSITGIIIMLGGTAIFAKNPHTTHYRPVFYRIGDNGGM